LARLVIVSNRVPAPRERKQLAGGLAVGLQDAIKGRDTLWFGWSGATGTETSKEATIDRSGKVEFATIDLSAADYHGFYRGFSNAMLWPLLHSRVGLAEFRRTDLETYQQVNRTFAVALQKLLRPDDLVWVHDYHLIPLGAELRRLKVTSKLGFFLHVPFPPPAVFDTLPKGAELAKSFSAYDLVGMQTKEDAGFLEATLAAYGVTAQIGTYPIGINPESFATAARRADGGPDARRLVQSLGGRALILGVDRLDYSKGLPQRFEGFAKLLKNFPQHRKSVTFLQVAPVSRGDVAQYRALRRELDGLAGRINGEHADFDWAPLRYLTRSVARNTLAGFHRIARVGLVTPLRDGMNLVAKEYVAAQNPEDPGALVLSRFAGAAAEMEGAILVNPYDPDEIAEGLHLALAMDGEERRARWAQMYEAIGRNTAAKWAKGFLKDLEE